MIDSVPLEELTYGFDLAGVDPASLMESLRAVTADLMTDPARLTTWLTGLTVAQQTVGLNALRRLAGENPEPVAAPAPDDKRFADEGWKTNPMLHAVVEDYLIRSRAVQQIVDSSRLPEPTKRKARFAATMLMDSLAPSNVPWLNPAVVREAETSGGESLVRGLENFLDDVRSNGGRPRQVDASSFTLGKNLAASPGRIVLRNELMELIAYEPQTPKVFAQPLLCSPPWINKYYIMDLAPGRSFVEWAVRGGFQTFMISYRNPDASMARLTMDDYLRLGVLEALDAVRQLTGAKKVNIAALCLGGTLALLALAHLAAIGDDERIGWTTLTNTLIDFAEPGDLGVFTDERAIERLEQRMSERGYLEAAEMAGTFNWLRANDLIWSYVVSNWFMGRKPPAFDILAWNADSTRMPAAMHSQYLRACYQRNALVEPGAFSICGTPIDLGKIRTPLYVLGAENDHIAPWRAAYSTTQLVGGVSKFTLTSSGHIAGIVNPPDNKKARFWTKPQTTKGESAEAWLRTAVGHDGSWWNEWLAWAAARSGAQRAPWLLPAGEPAPGKYVLDEGGPPIGVDGAPKPAPAKRRSRGRRA